MAAPGPAVQQTVVLSQLCFPSTVSYLLGRGLVVQAVPPQEADSPQGYNQLFERAKDADGLLLWPCDLVDEHLLREAPTLKAVSVVGSTHKVVVSACTARGVRVAATDASHATAAAAELALLQALALCRGLLPLHALSRTGMRTLRPGAYGSSFAGASIGVVGCGPLALAIAHRAAAFGPASIALCDAAGEVAAAAAAAAAAASSTSSAAGSSPSSSNGSQSAAAPIRVELPVLRGPTGSIVPLSLASNLPELLSLSDVVFLSCPLLHAKTRHLIDAPALAASKHGLVLVNAGAAGLVEEGAVAAALRAGSLGGYAADDIHDAAVATSSASPRGVSGKDVKAAAAAVAAASLKTGSSGGGGDAGADDDEEEEEEEEVYDLIRAPRTLFTPRAAGAVAGLAQRLELEAARALAEALAGRRPAGALNEPIPVSPAAAAAAAARAAAGLFWCF